MLRVHTNDANLTLRDRPTNWGAGVWLYHGKPFSGIMYENYSNTSQVLDEVEFKDGIINGRQAQYWQNGNLKEEYFQRFDSLIGSFKQWNEQGILISHTEYDQFGNLIKRIL